MHLLSKIIVLFVSNLIGIFLASYFVPGFEMVSSLEAFAKVTVIFTVINLIIRPIIKLIFTPVIIITLGLGVIVVNAIVLYLLDLASSDLSISGLEPLIYATLIIGVINIIINFSAKHSAKKEE